MCSNSLFRAWLVALAVVSLIASGTTNGSAAGGSSSATVLPSQWVTTNSTQKVALGDGVKVVLSTDTKLLRLPTIPTPVRGKDISPRAYVFELVRGRVDVDIDMAKPPYHTVMVRGPRRIAAYLKGGRSTIIASDQGVAVAALTGAEISGGIGDKWRPVRVGTALVVGRDHPAGETRTLLARPALTVTNGLNLSLGNPNATVLSWSAIPDARSYRLTLASDSDDVHSAPETFELMQTSFAIPGLKPGHYTAVVCAADAWQLTSPESNTVSVRVVGVELPEGAYLRNGIPQLGVMQAVRLSHTDGLEIAYGTGTIFGPAPYSVHLSSSRALSMRLREVGKTEEVALRLEPRSVASSIVFVPSRAQWPGKPINVSVNISGPEGSPLPDSINVNLSTSINSEAIDVQWDRVGNTWTARIEQPPMAGPWVLRVTASDQSGQMLARNFIEIASPSKSSKSSSANSYYSRR